LVPGGRPSRPDDRGDAIADVAPQTVPAVEALELFRSGLDVLDLNLKTQSRGVRGIGVSPTSERYRGLAKTGTRSFVALGLANIYLARKRLMP
jgi:hypothetical protein